MRTLALSALLLTSCAAPSAAQVAAPSHRPMVERDWEQPTTTQRTTTTRASRAKTSSGAARVVPPLPERPAGAPSGGGAGSREAPAQERTGQIRPAPVWPTPAGPCGGWRSLLAKYTWDVDRACRVLMCESGGDPSARNGRYHGLMQVDGGSFDPATNVAQAFAMWSQRGWRPWTCR